jgi:transposase
VGCINRTTAQLTGFGEWLMKTVIAEFFYGIVEQLLSGGYVDSESYFVDRPKIEASAN